MDNRTLEQLKRLQMMKDEAVRNEDYQMAKNLKERIQRLKNLGEQISLLESRKEKAIQKEDYDSAMVLKEEIQRLRNQFEIGNVAKNDFGRERERERERERDRDRDRERDMGMRMQREREIEMNMNRMRGFSDPPQDFYEKRNPSTGREKVQSINTSANRENPESEFKRNSEVMR